jgi:hypothetical protein
MSSNIRSLAASLAFVALLFFDHQAQAALRFPELTAVTRESPATLAPGETLRYRFAVAAGTSPAAEVVFAFVSPGFGTFRTLRSAQPLGTTVASPVDADWINGSYVPQFIVVRDAWSRGVLYRPDGTVAAESTPAQAQQFYTGPALASFNLGGLGFAITGARAAPPATGIAEATSLTPGTLRPGDTARIRYVITPASAPAGRIALTFRNVTGLGSDTFTAAATPGGAEFTLPITPAFANGTYRLNALQITDVHGRSYSFMANFNVFETADGLTFAAGYVHDVAFSQVGFTVEDASARGSAPRLTHWTREGGAELPAGSTLRLQFATAAAGFPVASVTARLQGPFGGYRDLTSTVASGVLELPVDSGWIAGPHAISRVTVTDAAGRASTYLPDGTITVSTGLTPMGDGHDFPASAFSFRAGGTVVPPSFTRQPAAETRVGAGTSVTLSAAAVAADSISWQWYRGEPGDTSQPVASGTGGSLAVTATTSATYWVRIGSDGQFTNSTAARILVVTPPVIVEHPVSRSVRIGETVTFAVAVSGTAPFTYRWIGGPDRPGQVRNEPTFAFVVQDIRDAGEVYCEVINAAGTAASNRATLTVVAADEPLRIVRASDDLVVSAGGEGSAVLEVVYSGNPPLTARWFRNGVELPPATPGYRFVDVVIGDGTTGVSRLSISAPTPAHSGKYRLAVSNQAETVYSREMEIRVVEAPVITRQPPASYATVAGGTIRVSVQAAGTPPLAYQWRHNGTAIAGANEYELARPLVTAASAGIYDVVVSNAAGSVTSTGCIVSVGVVAEPPAIIAAPPSRTAIVGEAVTFTVVASGTDLTYVWYRNGVVLKSGPESALALPGVGASDSGNYQVVVSTPGGPAVSATFSLTVLPTQQAPRFVRQPESAIIQRGTTAFLLVALDGDAPMALQWRRNGVPLTPGSAGFHGADATELTIPGFDSSRAGTFDVVATNAHGSAVSQPAALALPPPGREGRLMNLSVRATAGGEHGPLIMGFHIGGGVPEAVPLLVRAAGPALQPFGVTDVLADPSATLYIGQSVLFVSDDWGGIGMIETLAARVGAFPFLDRASKDAAFAPMVNPGSYTVHIQGPGDARGAALAEIYDATPATEINISRPRLLNLSVQTRTTAADVVIVGFALGGEESRNVLIRAVGPSLATFGVQGWASDPQVTLYRGSTAMAGNDDWAGAPSLIEAFAATGAFALSAPDSKDAALLIPLSPGPYTVQAAPAGEAGGLVLVEVYEVP